MRVVSAMDPRRGDGWGTVAALRAPITVALAVASDVAVYGFHVAIPSDLVVALNGLALAILAHDTGVMRPTPSQ